MRCLACNCVLSDREATRRSITTNDFLDLCDHCFSTVSDVVSFYDNPSYGEDEYESDEAQED